MRPLMVLGLLPALVLGAGCTGDPLGWARFTPPPTMSLEMRNVDDMAAYFVMNGEANVPATLLGPGESRSVVIDNAEAPSIEFTVSDGESGALLAVFTCTASRPAGGGAELLATWTGRLLFCSGFPTDSGPLRVGGD